MKNAFLLTLSLMLVLLASAQTKSRTPVKEANDRYANIEVGKDNSNKPPEADTRIGSADTIWNKSGQLNRRKISNGQVAIYSAQGKYTLYAHYKNRKLTGYSAVDGKGQRLNWSTVTRQVAGKFKCFVCVRVCNDAGKCAEDCTEEPCPKDMEVEKASSKERPKPEDPDQGGEIFKKSEKRVKQ